MVADAELGAPPRRVGDSCGRELSSARTSPLVRTLQCPLAARRRARPDAPCSIRASKGRPGLKAEGQKVGGGSLRVILDAPRGQHLFDCRNHASHQPGISPKRAVDDR